jgi:phosphatidate cytidylyltransferase
MKMRTLASLVIVPVVLVISLFTPKLVAAICFGLLAALGAYELLNNTKLVRYPRMVFYSMCIAFLMSMWSYFGCPHTVALAIIWGFFVLMFMEMMLSKMKVSFSQVAVSFVGAIVIPYLFCSLVRILTLSDGRYYILMPFTIAFSSDCFAYLVGSMLGKHKLAPTISPKKSIEGLVGGLVAAIVAMVIYGIVLQYAFDFRVNYVVAVIYAVVGTTCGVFGDLCFSMIKRQTNIKDFGNLIPGHGGVLDRFDSMIVIAPLVELLLLMMPMAVKG